MSLAEFGRLYWIWWVQTEICQSQSLYALIRGPSSLGCQLAKVRQFGSDSSPKREKVGKTEKFLLLQAVDGVDVLV
jgi:hypothetical protein